MHSSRVTARMVETERVACTLCGRDDTRFLFMGWDRRHGVPGEFPVVQCKNCGLIYPNPRPAPATINQYYPDEYEPYIGLSAKPNQGKTIREYGFRKRCRLVVAYKPGGRLLDVGTATGDFLHAMAAQGEWELYGVEPNEKAALIARTYPELQISVGTLDDVAYPPNYFDVITLWDVLEHLPDPRATLLEIRRIIKYDGVLIFQVPNLASWEARIFGFRWVGWDVPRHLHLLTSEVLGQLLDVTGFKPIGSSCPGGGYDTFFESLSLWLRETRWHRSGQGIQRLRYSLLARAIAWPLFELARRLKRSPAMVVVASPVAGSEHTR